MSQTPNRSWMVWLSVLSGIGVAIFLLGVVIGYCNGAFGDGGSNEQGLDWAVKTGFLLLAMSAFSGVIGGLILPKLQRPLSIAIGWAFILGLGLAIMEGGGTAMGMDNGDIWPNALGGFIHGGVIGGIVGLLQQRMQKERAENHSNHQDSA